MSTLTSSRHYCSLVWLYNVTYNSISISYHSAICRECRQKIRSIPHPNYDENYDNGAAASDYEVGGGGADVAGGSNVVRDRDEYGFGGHGNGEGNDDDDHVGDSGGIGDSCNGDLGGSGSGHVKKGDDDGNGIAVELDSDHELVATEDYSDETILVSNTFRFSVHLINKGRSGS